MSDEKKIEEKLVPPEKIDYLARLVRINLSEAEKKQFAGDLSKIVGFFQQIGRLDTSELTPLCNVLEEHRNFLRKDKIVPTSSREQIKKLTHHFSDGHFVVPKVVE